ALPNSGGFPGWYPICPPRGSSVHRYYFLVIAQDDEIASAKNVEELANFLKKHAIAYGWSVIVYKR
ncbi:MAG TPA: YbhB/YbcL family Raf kinase inhibitor-like protein, partial [Desulfobacterales bacterium]|nr:YbhB/YbcL family Raf kinase inhibitor-like protein [Desulfobacterales bacterium]